MHFSLIALTAWASLALATPSNVCTSGEVGRQLSRRDEPGVQLYCSQKLYPNSWKTESPDWQSVQSKTDMNKVKSTLNTKLGYSLNTYCKCIKGMLPACPENQKRCRDFSKCVCKPGTVKGSYGGCTKCPNGQAPSQDQKTCVCPSGQTKNENTCKPKCRSDQTTDSKGSCACKPTEDDHKGACVPKCSTDKTRNNEGKCVCPTGQTEVSGKCTTTVRCRSDQIVIKSQCVCDTGKEEYKGACKTVCLTGQSRDNNGDCKCPSGKEVVKGTCQPVCAAEGQTRDNNGDCKCPNGKSVVAGKCLPTCRSDQDPTRASNGDCRCPGGKSEVGGKCLPTCRSDQDQINRDSNGDCQCETGKDEYQNRCIRSCSDGKVHTGDTGVCQCPEGEELREGRCQPELPECFQVPSPYVVGTKQFKTVCDEQFEESFRQPTFIDFKTVTTFRNCMDTCAADGACQAITYDRRAVYNNCWLFGEGYQGLSAGNRGSDNSGFEFQRDRAYLLGTECRATFINDNGQCKCPDTKIAVNNKCVPMCRTDQDQVNRLPSGECQCPQDQSEIGGVCRTACRADQDSDRDANGNCQCPQGKTESHGQCVDPCRADQSPDRDSNGNCQCPPDQMERELKPGQKICRSEGRTCDMMPIIFEFGTKVFQKSCGFRRCDEGSEAVTNAPRIDTLASGTFEECVGDCDKDPNCLVANWNRVALTCDLLNSDASILDYCSSADYDSASYTD